MDTKLKAPKGKFRVVGVDTFSHEDWVQGDFDNVNDAKREADHKGGNMTRMYVYDEAGKCIHAAGTY